MVDLLNWISTPMRFPLTLSLVFVAYFIRAYFRGASFGARLDGEHRPVIVLVMAWVR